MIMVLSTIGGACPCKTGTNAVVGVAGADVALRTCSACSSAIIRRIYSSMRSLSIAHSPLVSLFERAACVVQIIGRITHMNDDIYFAGSRNISKREGNWYL